MAISNPIPVNRSRSEGELGRPHVCMIVHSHYPVGEPRAEREALAAADAGYVVDLICLRRPHEPARETVQDVGVIRLPIQHIRGAGALRSVSEYLGFALRATAAALKIHRRTPIDVVYVHAPPDFLIVTALIPKLLGSGVVLDIHDLSPHMFDARFGNGRLALLAQRALRLVERGACAVADRVVTVHDPYRDELAAHGVPSDKIAVVMNAPVTDAADRARAAAALQGASSTFLVAYHGTVTHWYGVDLIVEAIASLKERIPGLRALILGEGDALDAAEQLARQLGVDRRIDFSGAYVSHAEALSRVAGASCGVIPNRRSRLNRFALSSKLLDYVELGIPVVVARLETLAAHFSPDEVTFFEPDDPEALARALAWVAEHPAEAREKAERAQRRAEAYSWATSRTRLLEALSCAAS
jgi:glycosyltransferase involved in cell wall biosynthesis